MFISAKEDNTSVLYQGRAKKSSIEDEFIMENTEWRDRLAQAIKSSGKSKRAVSLKSGNGPGYVHSIISEGKDPTISNLIAVCDAVPVSIINILHGTDITPEDAELLRILKTDPEKLIAIQRLIKPAPPK